VSSESLFRSFAFITTPHHDTVICRFDGDKVAIESVASIAFRKRLIFHG